MSTSRVASTVAFSNARRPYPLFSSINYADNGANMLYSGLQTAVQKRFSKGLMFTSTWTWAKELSDTDDTGDFELNNTIENSYDRRRDRGNVYSVPRHQWMNQALYELPLGKGQLLAGWQVNMLLNLSYRQLVHAGDQRTRSQQHATPPPCDPT